MTDKNDGREIAATIVEGTGNVISLLGTVLGSEPGVRAGLEAAGGGLKVVARLIRQFGAQPAKEALLELQKRVASGEGIISSADIVSDDAEVDAAIGDMYLDREHPPDGHASERFDNEESP